MGFDPPPALVDSSGRKIVKKILKMQLMEPVMITFCWGLNQPKYGHWSKWDFNCMPWKFCQLSNIVWLAKTKFLVCEENID